MAMTAEEALLDQAQTATFVWQMSTQGDPYAGLLLRQINPYRFCEKAREQGALTRSKVGPWVTPDYAVAREILRDRRFGTRLASGERAFTQFTSMDDSFLKLDPPDHGRLRRIVTPFFGHRRFDAWRPRIENLCEDLLDAVDLSEPFDLVAAYVRPLMNTLVRDLFRVPDELSERFDRNCATAGRVFEGFASPEQYQELEVAVRDLRELLAELLELRRTRPDDDVVTEMLKAVEQNRLTLDEAIGVCGLLAIAGTESTSHLISNATLALLENRDQWDLLLADPDLAPRVVEETLRYDPPNQLISRAVHEDLTIAGQDLKCDDPVIIMTGGANRDPKVFADPNCFDILREDGSESLTFSTGMHFCLGAALARTAADIALRVLTARHPDLHRSGPVKRRQAASVRGLSSLPVQATA